MRNRDESVTPPIPIPAERRIFRRPTDADAVPNRLGEPFVPLAESLVELDLEALLELAGGDPEAVSALFEEPVGQVDDDPFAAASADKRRFRRDERIPRWPRH